MQYTFAEWHGKAWLIWIELRRMDIHERRPAATHEAPESPVHEVAGQ
jgi:hypothetical protein